MTNYLCWIENEEGEKLVDKIYLNAEEVIILKREGGLYAVGYPPFNPIQMLIELGSLLSDEED